MSRHPSKKRDPKKVAKKAAAKKGPAKKAAAKPTPIKRGVLLSAEARQRHHAHATAARTASAVEAIPTRSLNDVLGSIDLATATKAAPAPAKPSRWYRFRCAITGLFTGRKHAEDNPATTVRERGG